MADAAPAAGHEHAHDQHEPDLDLVEMAFVEGFATAKDPASFLRLARIPFEAVDAAGTKLVMLRVESDAVTDVGALMPHLGGGAHALRPAAGAHGRRTGGACASSISTAARRGVLTLGEVRGLKE